MKILIRIIIFIYIFLQIALSYENSKMLNIDLDNTCWNNTQTYKDIKLYYIQSILLEQKILESHISQDSVKNYCNQYYYFEWIKNMARVHCNHVDLKNIEDSIQWINLENLDELCISKSSWCSFPKWTLVFCCAVYILCVSSICLNVVLIFSIWNLIIKFYFINIWISN